MQSNHMKNYSLTLGESFARIRKLKVEFKHIKKQKYKKGYD